MVQQLGQQSAKSPLKTLLVAWLQEVHHPAETEAASSAAGQEAALGLGDGHGNIDMMGKKIFFSYFIKIFSGDTEQQLQKLAHEALQRGDTRDLVARLAEVTTVMILMI